MAKAFIGMGTNLGKREANLREALRQLAPEVKVVKESSVYETMPWGVTNQPPFLNMVIEGETKLEPEALLGALKGIEREMGRRTTVRYGPRVIDLDILLYDDLVWDTTDLHIPHTRLAERRFVLVPLAEIAPKRIHPVFGKTMEDLLAQVRGAGDVMKA